MKAVVAILLVSLALAAARSHQQWKDEFNAFTTKYNRQYENAAESAQRFAIFQKNMLVADELNKKNPSAKYGANQFADISPEEFAATQLMSKFSGKSQFGARTIDLPEDQEIPTAFDWSSKNAVTPVKNQGQCGSCWAFSATEAVESQWFLAGNTLPVLAPQQIVDCDVGGEDAGCGGGDTTTAYEYLIKQGGLESEDSYPYVGEDDTCAFAADKVVAKISNWTYITTNQNETEMQVGLYAKGPLSICVDAASWQYYLGGIVSDSFLCGQNLDHCVMITGFQDITDIFGTYHVWNVRNSWGDTWGEEGYIWVARGSNLCGIADEVTIPLIH